MMGPESAAARLVSIVLPVYRQADHIVAVVEAYDRWLDALSGRYELILVSNGPDDGSLKACQGLAKRSKRVRVVRSEKGGWGLAGLVGLIGVVTGIVGYCPTYTLLGIDTRPGLPRRTAEVR